MIKFYKIVWVSYIITKENLDLFEFLKQISSIPFKSDFLCIKGRFSFPLAITFDQYAVVKFLYKSL